jgi:tetratricopeptide (TPR) repeat protein
MLFSALMLAQALSLYAFAPGTLTGKVTSKAGQPISKVVLTLKQTDTSWSKNLVVKPDGTFEQAGLDPKEYELTAIANGYMATKRKVTIPAGGTVTNDILLLTAAEALELAKAGKAPTATKDSSAANNQNYQPVPDALAAYKQGADAFNADNKAAAKPFFQKAISIDPKYAESYYLLAMCEWYESNYAASKGNFNKYLELAPNGKNAATAKEMLNDPTLKKQK